MSVSIWVSGEDLISSDLMKRCHQFYKALINSNFPRMTSFLSKLGWKPGKTCLRKENGLIKMKISPGSKTLRSNKLHLPLVFLINSFH